MMTNINLTPVVKACPLQMSVIQAEAQGVNQVEPQFGRSAEPGDIAGV